MQKRSHIFFITGKEMRIIASENVSDYFRRAFYCLRISIQT